MCTAPVPRVVPAALRLGAVDLPRGRVRLSALSRGSVGMLVGPPASSGVPRVIKTFSNRKWLRLSCAMCEVVLLSGGKPEFLREQC
jgi:hypothetical protein